VRVFGPSLLPVSYAHVITCAAVLWLAAFGLYAWVYTPILLGPRADGKPGRRRASVDAPCVRAYALLTNASTKQAEAAHPLPAPQGGPAPPDHGGRPGGIHRARLRRDGDGVGREARRHQQGPAVRLLRDQGGALQSGGAELRHPAPPGPRAGDRFEPA